MKRILGSCDLHLGATQKYPPLIEDTEYCFACNCIFLARTIPSVEWLPYVSLSPVGFIYLITNKITGFRYVGQTRRSIEERFAEHRQSAQQNKGHLLHQSIRDCGIENFTLEKLTECPYDELDKMEQKYIKELSTQSPKGYNSAGNNLKPYWFKKRQAVNA